MNKAYGYTKEMKDALVSKCIKEDSKDGKDGKEGKDDICPVTFQSYSDVFEVA
jgi:hypothetical protein